MGNVIHIEEYRAKHSKLSKADAERTARALLAFERHLDLIERQYQEQLKRERGELS